MKSAFAGIIAAACAGLTSVAVPAMTDGDQPDAAARAADVFTIRSDSIEAFQQPLPVLTVEQLAQFKAGRQGFEQRWVVAPSILGLWGRGPTSNGEVCTDCHQNGGRGRPPEYVSEPMQSMLVRLSVPGTGPHGGPKPHAAYGDQLQNEGILGRVPPEGDPRLTWETHTIAFADGEIVSLRAPILEFWHLSFGPLGADVMTSARVAPAIVGVGLLDAVAERTLLARAAMQRELGLSGRANLVWDFIDDREAVGRFGRKANQPSLEQQIVTAYHADLGVTSRWFPEENCTEVQIECLQQKPGGYPELPPALLDPVFFYTQALAVPARRNVDDPRVREGELLFARVGCDGCHSPDLETGEYPALPALSHLTIHPYTDLLLHDMGEGLADGRPDFKAGARDWRTAPLWGVGLARNVNGNELYLHDGRARTLAEAILWHGGEAEASREAFRTMARSEREALLAFLRSL